MNNSNEEEGGVEGLIELEKEIKPKPRRYKSKYSPHIFPTATTFCLKTTSITGAGNLAGHYAPRKKTHDNKAFYSTFGRPKSALPLKEQKNIVGNDFISAYTQALKERKLKEKIPKHDELAPLKREEKNFIKNNLNLEERKKNLEKKKEIDFLKKKYFGKSPSYLNEVKNRIEQERENKNKNQIEKADSKKRTIKKEEAQQLKENLKKKWEILNLEYAKAGFFLKTDSKPGIRRKKEIEDQMNQIEQQLKFLSKLKILINFGSSNLN